MTDRVPPKAKKKAGKDKVKKIVGPKMVAKPSLGHNSNNGSKNPEAIKMLDELLNYGEQKKRIAKAERDIRNKFKVELGILAGPLAHELRLRKMDNDVRVQFESNHGDLKKMLGYQPELDFQGSVPTTASVKSQPSEKELAERDTGPRRDAPAPQDEADDLEPPAFLKRARKPEPEADAEEDEAEGDDSYEVEDEHDADDEGVIEREG